MTRKEMMCDVAKEQFTYVKDENLKSALQFAFIDGVEWADENIKEIWHDASKEPQREYDIMCQDKFGGVWLTDYQEEIAHYKNGWEDYVARKCMTRWAYISDLLPKKL